MEITFLILQNVVVTGQKLKLKTLKNSRCKNSKLPQPSCSLSVEENHINICYPLKLTH